MQGGNEATANSHGGEWVIRWQPSPEWELSVNYSYLYADFSVVTSAQNTAAEAQPDSNPRHKGGLIVSHNLSHGLEVDLQAFYTSKFSFLENGINKIDAPNHIQTNLRFAWKATLGLQFGLFAENLFDDHYIEYPAQQGSQSFAVRRTVQFKLKAEFWCSQALRLWVYRIALPSIFWF